MRLPVIQTCGDCSRISRTRFDGRGEPFCLDDRRATIDARKPPPSWCPLRTGPDAERIAALEAVAVAAVPFVGGTAVSARRGASLADEKALDAALARLRSLT